jgi:hypothetical protein
MDDEAVVHPQASCNGAGGANPIYDPVLPSQTYCSLVIYLPPDGDNAFACTATFIAPNMVVTAGYCITNPTKAMTYEIDPAEPGKFTCYHDVRTIRKARWHS